MCCAVPQFMGFVARDDIFEVAEARVNDNDQVKRGSRRLSFVVLIGESPHGRHVLGHGSNGMTSRLRAGPCMLRDG